MRRPVLLSRILHFVVQLSFSNLSKQTMNSVLKIPKWPTLDPRHGDENYCFYVTDFFGVMLDFRCDANNEWAIYDSMYDGSKYVEKWDDVNISVGTTFNPNKIEKNWFYQLLPVINNDIVERPPQQYYTITMDAPYLNIENLYLLFHGRIVAAQTLKELKELRNQLMNSSSSSESNSTSRPLKKRRLISLLSDDDDDDDDDDDTNNDNNQWQIRHRVAEIVNNF